MDSVPREIIEMIFMAAADVQCAARLGQVNKRLLDVWMSFQEQILSSILLRSVDAFDDALQLATSTRSRMIEQSPDLNIKLVYLVRLIEANAKQCSLVRKLWEERYTELVMRNELRPWNGLRAASFYYRSRQATIAFESPQGRLQIRRRLNKLSDDDLLELTDFIVWWVMDCNDQGMRDVHDMGMTNSRGRAVGLEWDEAQYCKPDKWCWTVETISLLNMRRRWPDEEIGASPKMYSNVCSYGYQLDWW